MYKTVFLDYDEYGSEIQDGNVDKLNNLLNDEYKNGWELVSMTTSPWVLDSGRCDYVLVLKKRTN